MNIGGLKNKVISNADKVGTVIGAAGALKIDADAWYAQSGKMMAHFKNALKQAMKDPHFPDVSHVLSDLTEGYSSKVVIPAVQLYIGAEIAGWLGFVEKRYTAAVKKGSLGAVKGAALYSLFVHSGLKHSSPASGGGFFGGSSTPSGDPYRQELY